VKPYLAWKARVKQQDQAPAIAQKIAEFVGLTPRIRAAIDRRDGERSEDDGEDESGQDQWRPSGA